jgi:hypothetical protein
MSTTNPPATPPTPTAAPAPAPLYPDWTEADAEAIFASVVWFREQGGSEFYEQYKGMHVAVLGERIIDADANKEELVKRVEARAGTIQANRVLYQYLPTEEEALRY